MFELVIRNGKVVDGTGSDAFQADVAISEGKIAEIGRGLGQGKREIDAEGAIVTPGFVDAHTHYDGQVTWDPELSPSSWHGVTTAVMGNCGVGFAPARPAERDFTIRVMEGVEEIPGSALAEGMSWDWETFPEYLDSLDRQERAVDVVTQVPHCALRCYVMGEERALEAIATSEDISRMAELTAEALKAGAAGFSTSRTMIHRVKDGGEVPGTRCKPEELIGIAGAFQKAGHGVFQMISDLMGRGSDWPWMKQIAKITGGPLVFTLAQVPYNKTGYQQVLKNLGEAQASEGLDIRAAVPWRPPGVLLGLQATMHPFMFHPSFQALEGRPLDESVRTMADPAFRKKVLSEKSTKSDPMAQMLLGNFSNQFVLGDPPDYEPRREQSLQARAMKLGKTPMDLAYDTLMQLGGKQLIYSPLISYSDFNFDALYEMLTHPRSTASLSDGGAHVGTICDASVTSYMLSYWARDRERGPRIRLEDVIRKQCAETAALYDLSDRGVIAPGMRADLNVIDYDHLRLHAPYMAFDLPTGGKRLLQKADGFRATLVAGEVIAENGEMTGARPGKLVRGPQHA